jgi:hypothetical protein
MLAARQLKAAATRLDGSAKSFVACAEAWNSTQLCFGDHAAVTAREQIRVRNNQWSLHGTLRVACSRVQASLKDARRCVDARAAVVYTSLALQRDQMKDYIGKGLSSLFLQRCYDGTPAHVDFGCLAEAIAPFAKYVVPHSVAARIGKPLA